MKINPEAAQYGLEIIFIKISESVHVENLK